MSGASTLEDAIDDLPFGWFHIRLLALVAAIMLLDGFDLQVSAFTAPAILKAWSLTPAAFGPVAAAALIGVAIGTAAGGALGDRFGRRSLLLAGVAWFGLGALASAASQSVVDLAALRLFTGLGLGAVIPNAAALAAEWTPKRYRAHAVTLVIIGPPLGGMIGAGLAAWLIPAFGWRACMLVGAVGPLLLLAALWAALRESPYHLQRRGASEAALGRLLVSAGGDARFIVVSPTSLASSGVGLLRAGLARATLGLCLAFMGAMLVLYGYLSWIPVILTSVGIEQATAIRASLVFNLCGVIGAVLAAQAIRSLGSRFALLGLAVAGLAATALCAGLIGSGLNAGVVLGGLGLAGAAIFSLQVGLYGLATHVYPAAVRATGVGMAATIGRVGAIIGAFGGGSLLAASSGLNLYFGALGLGLLLALIGLLVVDQHSPAIRIHRT